MSESPLDLSVPTGLRAGIDDGPRRFAINEVREAMLVTPDNLDAIAAWCGGEVLPGRDGVSHKHLGHGDRVRRARVHMVRTGRVLVTDGQEWWDVTPRQFAYASRSWEETT